MDSSADGTAPEIGRTEQASHVVYGGTWVGGAIAMAANIGNAVVTFGAVGGNRVVGGTIGAAVDVALIVALIGDRQLAKHGARSGWSWALQGYTMIMGAIIAVSAAAETGHYLLALLLGMVGPLLWLLMNYGQDAAIQFARIVDGLRRPTEPVVVPTEPVRAPVFEPFPTVRIDPVSRNGHHNDDGGAGWRFAPPPWAGPTPAPEPAPDVVAEPSDEEGAEVGLDGPRTEPVDEPIGDGLPSLEAVREWRATQRAAGKPIGRDALRERFGLSEREARAVVAAVKRADAEQLAVVGS